MLKIFDGFAREQASDLSGLTVHEIQALLKHRIITPEKTRYGYKYSFQDLLMLRLIRDLKVLGAKISNIKNAHIYLKELDPSKRLTNFKLYIDDSSKSILYLGEKPNEFSMVSMDRYGQLVASGLLTILPVGTALEETRKGILKLDRDLANSMRSKKVISLESLKKEYGLV